VHVARHGALCALLVLADGCVALTPSTRSLPLETVEPVGGGRTGEQITFARDTNGPPEIDSGALRVRRGLGADTDVSVEATGWWLPSYRQDSGGQHVWTGRAGVKRRLRQWLAVEGGAGGGIIVGTPFLGPDVGAIAAWENGVLVPFLGLRGAVSIPLAATPVIPGGYASTLQPTAYGQISLGARLPIGGTAPSHGELRGSLLGGFGWTGFAVGGNSGHIDGFALGGEVTF
jgi:hypothetical protein